MRELTLGDAEWLELVALSDEIVEDAALIIHGRMPSRLEAVALSELEISVRLVLRSVALALRAQVVAAAPAGSIFAPARSEPPRHWEPYDPYTADGDC